MQRPRAYVRLTIVSAVSAVLLAGLLNVLIDPYGLYTLVDRDGFNRRKPIGPVNGYMSKPYQVQRVQPKTLLLGSSRVEMALDPESAQWTAAVRPVFNMALPASGIDIAVRSLRHVLTTAPPDTVVLGVDFFDFLLPPPPAVPRTGPPPEPSDFEKRLLVNIDGSRNSRYALQRAKDVASSIFSFNAFVDSALTVALQREDQANMTPLGFNVMGEFPRMVERDGHYPMFWQVTTGYLTNYIRSSGSIFQLGTISSPRLDQLRELIRLCSSSGVRLIIFIHPSHAYVLEAYRIAGLWPMFEEWKRVLVRLLAEKGAAGGSIHLWDFSQYSEITSERVPAAGKRGVPMKWYWEAGHYKREVGDLVIARVLQNGDAAPPGFGVELTAQNLESHLASIREGRAHYASEHRDEVEALDKLGQTLRAEMR